MKKLMTFEHLDNENTLKVHFLIEHKDDHWVARMEPLGENPDAPRSPTFYGTSAEQAERQLRKVFEKDYELVSEEPL